MGNPKMASFYLVQPVVMIMEVIIDTILLKMEYY
jgi:hypothetical protein